MTISTLATGWSCGESPQGAVPVLPKPHRDPLSSPAHSGAGDKERWSHSSWEEQPPGNKPKLDVGNEAPRGSFCTLFSSTGSVSSLPESEALSRGAL